MKKLALALVAAAGLFAAAAPTSALAVTKHGAIAYDMDSGRYGWSYNYGSDWQARNAAMNSCGWSGCRVYVSFYNTCAALATDNGRGIYGWGAAYNRGTATERALYECRVRGGNCSIKVWSCTDR